MSVSIVWASSLCAGRCRGAKCLALGLAVEFCEDKKRGQWCKLFGTDDKVKLGSRFCLILEYLAAEDHMASSWRVKQCKLPTCFCPGQI